MDRNQATNHAPRVTMITATYNKPEFLRDAGRSLLAQTVPWWRWWLILDGPDAETVHVADEFARADRRICVFHEPTTDAARWATYRPAEIINDYYPRVETPYLCWLSDDDLLESEYLELLVGTLQECPDQDVVYGGCEVLLENGAGQWQHYRSHPAAAPIGRGTTVMPDCVIDGGQFVQTKRSYEALGGYRLPTDLHSAKHVDGLYMNELAQRFTFWPVGRNVMIKRITHLSTHMRGRR